MMLRLAALIWLVCLPASAALFNVEARRAELVNSAPARDACLAADIELDEDEIVPVAALGSTKGYGSDNSIEPFAWRVMVLTGRALAGDAGSEQALIALLDRWARADALTDSEDSHDAHFALKRALQPMIAAYDVIEARIESEQAARIHAWLDGLVKKIDRTFDGDVDMNNHRYLADAVLASWGAVTRDDALLDKGEGRFRVALLEQMRADGSLPLEARRGARAIWYHRQSLASLTAILAALDRVGRKPLAEPELEAAWNRTVTYFTDTVRWPRLVLRYASENYIPGPSDEYSRQDLGFLDQRGHGRHYLAWVEAALALTPDAEVRARLDWLLRIHAAEERPLIGDFSGGALTCFWWRPGADPGSEAIQ